MRTKRTVSVVWLMLYLTLTSCDSETGGGSSNTPQGDCPSVGDLVIEDNSSFGIERCMISGTLTVNATLPAGFNWYLDGSLRVNGGAVNARLTIEKGVHIRGSIESLVPDFIYISDQGSLEAIGDADNPIIISSNNLIDLNTAGGGHWGGLIIENSASASFPNRLEYVVVADGGAAFTLDGIFYRSNITVLGDNANTTMRYVQSHDADGDGIRLEGINAQNLSRMDWLLITGAGRDALSYDNFSGLVKDLLVVNRSDFYNNNTRRGGRAGIYAGGSNSMPLFVNATLVGRDNDSTAPDSSDNNNDEVGIIFASDITTVRLANVLIANYRNACYELKSGANLSALGIGLGDPTVNFIDGLHCANEFFDLDDQQAAWLIRSGDIGDNFSLVGGNNGNGANFYQQEPINFFGEGVVSGFTGEWYLESVGIFTNGLETGGTLNAYNNGNTGSASGSDINVLPLIVDDCSDTNGNQFYCSVDGESDTIDSSGYDLTHIGAIRSSADTQFNSWTLQTGGGDTLNTIVTGFVP